MNVGLLDHLLALALVVALPAFGAWEYPKFVERARTRPGLRRREYQFTIAMEWGLVAVALVIWRIAGRGWAELGLVVPGDARTLIGAAITVAGLAFVVLQLRALRRGGEKAREEARRQVAEVEADAFLPQTHGDRLWWSALSLTAGVCEELLYRGFLLWYLAAFIGTWPGFVVGSLAFGIAHLYQGAKGVLKTLIVGTIHGLLYLGTGSLLWPMILHAALDLGAIGFARLLDEPATSGAS